MFLFRRVMNYNPFTEEDIQLVRLKEVLLSAQSLHRYHDRLQAAGLRGPEAVAGLTKVEQALNSLPGWTYDEFLRTLSDSGNRDSPRPPLQRLQYPLGLTPKLIMLMPGFERTSGMKMGALPDLIKAQAVHADALAAPLSVLRALAVTIQSRTSRIAPLRYPVVVFTGVIEGIMTDADRDLFWQVFQVPTFEQFLGFDGRVLAIECEARQGLHIETASAIFEKESSRPDSELLLTSLTYLRHPTLRVGTGLIGRVERSCCECGRSEARLQIVRPAGGVRPATPLSFAARN